MPAPRPSAARPSAPSPSLSSTTWTALGPAPLASPYNSNNVSGRITGIAADPSNANVIYVTPAGGGVWETTNGGTSWTPLTDGQSTLSMGAIAMGTTTTGGKIIYAGTGEADNSLDSNYGRGILISKDGGATWTLSAGPSNAFNRLTTAQIAVDPTNSLVAYAAMGLAYDYNGLYGANTGIWKTMDGGTTWTNMTKTINSSLPWSAVVIDPNNHQTLYAAAGYYVGATTNGVYKSTNGGTTWTKLAKAPAGTAAGRIAIALSKANSQVVYVTASHAGNVGTTGSGALYKIVRSDNGGSTFTDLTPGTPNYMGTQGWYDTYVAVDPSNAAIVYVAGQAGANSILRSTNSGRPGATSAAAAARSRRTRIIMPLFSTPTAFCLMVTTEAFIV
jgi:photosystem II stability/assembly factor-like uncharacterized protein